MVLQVRRWLPDRELILVTDGGFAAVELARTCKRHHVAMICRMRLDAALYGTEMNSALLRFLCFVGPEEDSRTQIAGAAR
jgi:hypothetical protein